MGSSTVRARQRAAAVEQPNIETVVITGSYIRRTDKETPSHAQVVSAEVLHQSGYNSLQRVLGDLRATGQGALCKVFPVRSPAALRV
jgi:hypothetical protein